MRALKVGAALSVAAGIWVVAGSARVQGESASPSVREAARLKYNPPPNWIRHYLGDDRYKIAGGAWRVVSTETDTYYYPAWAPEMLRQSNGIVIGFPSSAAAEEAGYKRSRYPMDSPLLGITGHPLPTPVPPPSPPVTPGAASSPFGGLALPQGVVGGAVNRGAARRITLADGSSTALLPPGWSYASQDQGVPSNGRPGSPQKVHVTVLVPGKITPDKMGQSNTDPMVVFAFMDLPPGMRAEAIFNPATMGRYANAAQGGQVNTRTSKLINGISAARWGNVSGVSLPYPVPRLGTVKLNIAGRGSKLYMLIDISRGAKGARQIISSFQGR